ncbi:hypothetical protein ABY43_11100 [Rhizobium giardinii]
MTLFATRNSLATAKLDGVVPAPYCEDPSIDAKVWEYRHLAYLFERADRFDIIHNQADFPAHAFSALVRTPMVTTIHGFSSERILPMYKPYEERVHFVAISNANRHPELRYAATIHHGIRVEDFTLIRKAVKTCFFSGGSIRTRGRRKPSRLPTPAAAHCISTASYKTVIISSAA